MNILVKLLHREEGDIRTAQWMVSALYVFGAFVVLKGFVRISVEYGYEASVGIVALFFVTSIFCLSTAYNTRSLVLRAAASFAFLISAYIAMYSPVKTDQEFLLITYVLLTLAFVPREKFLDGLHAARLVVLSTYALSGVFKLTVVFSNCAYRTMQCTPHGFAGILAENYLESGRIGVLTNFLVQHGSLVMAGYIAIALLQIGLPILYLLNIGRKWMGFEFIAFHIFIYLAMGVTFFENIIVMFILFILPFRKTESQSTS